MHPIYYMSATTSAAESRYASFELEMLAIHRSLEKFRVYLPGIPFKLVTDCNSLKLALSKREVNSRIFRWSVLLEDFNYTVEHRSSKAMQHVDALSRVSMMVHCDPDSELRFLKRMQQKDSHTKAIIDKCEQGISPQLKQYDLRNGILCYKHKNRRLLVVPRSMRRNIVCAAHDNNGHVGREKTIQKVLESYWFPKLRKYVAKHIKHCLKCITFNGESGKPSGRLHNIPKGNRPFLTLHCDHIGPLDPPSAGFKHILVVIDAYSKFVFLNATKTTNSREATKVIEQIFKTFGPPQTLICDRGSAFTSEEFTDFMKKHGVTRVLTATATPRANGQCERYNRTIGNVLAKVIKDNNWSAQLTAVQQVLNNSHQRSIDSTPAKLLVGYSLRTNSDQELRDLIQEAIQCPEPPHLEQRRAARDHAEVEQAKTQEDNERRYNLRRRPPNRYVVGDHVLIKSVRPAGKLQPKYQGPYHITKVLEHDRYVVEDIPGAKVTQRFYSGILPSDRIRLYASEDSPGASSSSEEEGELDAIEGDRNVRLAEAVVATKGACPAPEPSAQRTAEEREV